MAAVMKRAAYFGIDELKKGEQCDLGDDASEVTDLRLSIVPTNIHLVN